MPPFSVHHAVRDELDLALLARDGNRVGPLGVLRRTVTLKAASSTRAEAGAYPPTQDEGRVSVRRQAPSSQEGRRKTL